MKIKLKDVKVPPGTDAVGIKAIAAERLGVGTNEISDIKVIGEAIDARRKSNIVKVLSLAVETTRAVNAAGHEKYLPPVRLIKELGLSPKRTEKRIFIAGSGPAGMFCALTLARLGIKCVLLERGGDVDARDKEVGILRASGVLNPNCNVQFGEGGAGTYSDGKLNTGTNDSLINVVLGEFVEHGAPPEIERLSKPHIGTDYLKKVVKSLRNDLTASGSEVRFGTRLSNIEVKNGKISAIRTDGGALGEDCDILVVAIGHSARDTFEMLRMRGITMERKPFSMGVRIEHLQQDVDCAQYGARNPLLPPADYKHSFKLQDGRGVYTFCMCPGGEVVCAASEEGMLATNGMSSFARDKTNANSAVLVSVAPSDFGGGNNPLAGIELQRKYERLAYGLGGGGCKAPVQRWDDFAAGKVTRILGRVQPSYLPGVTFADLNLCLPDYVARGIKDGIAEFGKKMKCFSAGDSLLTGVETRSSSPVRLVRDDNYESNIKGVYPCGEGSGYSGGITSSAVDGIKLALKIYETI